MRRWAYLVGTYKPYPARFVYIWARLSLFTIESRGRATNLETHPYCVCSYLCLFDTIIELHAMDEKHSTTFSFESESGFCM